VLTNLGHLLRAPELGATIHREGDPRHLTAWMGRTRARLLMENRLYFQ
jgi:hypothetical protein